MKFSIYGFGNALVDHEIVATDADLQALEVKKSLMVLVDEARQSQVLAGLGNKIKKRSCGGSAANTVITAQQLGASSFYSYKVANDEAGQFFYQDLKKEGVASNFDTQSLGEGVTGKCMVMVTPDAERSMETFLGITAHVSEDELDFTALATSKYFYIEGYLVASESARKAAVKAKDYCEKNGIKTALTFSDPGVVDFFRDGMSEIVGNGMDLIFSNEKEALSFTESHTLTDAIEKMKKLTKTFVITRSAKGSIAYDGENLYTTAGKEIQALDTTGAGDVFAGAFLASLSQGFNYEKASLVANFAASLVVQKYGARLDSAEVKKVSDYIGTLK